MMLNGISFNDVKWNENPSSSFVKKKKKQKAHFIIFDLIIMHNRIYNGFARRGK